MNFPTTDQKYSILDEKNIMSHKVLHFLYIDLTSSMCIKNVSFIWQKNTTQASYITAFWYNQRNFFSVWIKTLSFISQEKVERSTNYISALLFERISFFYVDKNVSFIEREK